MDDKVRALLDKIQSAAQVVGDAAGSSARYVGKRANEMLDVTKLHLKIFDLNTEITTLQREIGAMVYDTHSGKETDDSALEQRLLAIDEKHRQITELRERINTLRQSKTCPSCGASSSKEDQYCKQCGSSL